MVMRLIRLFTGDDGQSRFAVGEIAWHKLEGPNALSGTESAQSISFEETAAGGLGHALPYLIPHFRDVLLAEDVTGGGHRWRLIDDQPWRRVYVHLP